MISTDLLIGQALCPIHFGCYNKRLDNGSVIRERFFLACSSRGWRVEEATPPNSGESVGTRQWQCLLMTSKQKLISSEANRGQRIVTSSRDD